MLERVSRAIGEAVKGEAVLVPTGGFGAGGPKEQATGGRR
jgi:hypothetical protein